MDDFQDPSEEFEADEFDDGEATLQCAYCQMVISHTQHVFHGADAGVFANPHGHVFDILTVDAVNPLKTHGKGTTAFTWFSGYSWQIVSCMGCGTHMGWRYQAVEPNRTPTVFWGLLRNHLKWA